MLPQHNVVPPTPVFWMGPAPTICASCREPLLGDMVHGATRNDPNHLITMHPACHTRIGIGMGPGTGQPYSRQSRVDQWLRLTTTGP